MITVKKTDGVLTAEELFKLLLIPDNRALVEIDFVGVVNKVERWGKKGVFSHFPIESAKTLTVKEIREHLRMMGNWSMVFLEDDKEVGIKEVQIEQSKVTLR